MTARQYKTSIARRGVEDCVLPSGEVPRGIFDGFHVSTGITHFPVDATNLFSLCSPLKWGHEEERWDDVFVLLRQ